MDSSEGLSVERALGAIRRSDIVVAIVDASEGITQQVCKRSIIIQRHVCIHACWGSVGFLKI